MQFIKEEYSTTYEIKKSKFIAYLCPYNDFNLLMKRLKEEHPKARHFVYAYRYLNEFEQIIENSSDDGEPKGTSGKPSLKVLEGNAFINTAVIIIRYFGGVKLGTGGLVRVYSDAVNQVCELSMPYIYEKLKTREIIIPYSDLSKVEYQINKLEISIQNKIFENNVKLILSATKEKLDKFSY